MQHVVMQNATTLIDKGFCVAPVNPIMLAADAPVSFQLPPNVGNASEVEISFELPSAAASFGVTVMSGVNDSSICPAWSIPKNIVWSE